MSAELNPQRLQEAANAFRNDFTQLSRYGNGHINDTFLAVTAAGDPYILQRLNRRVFPRPEEVIDNIRAVTSHLRSKLQAAGGDPTRETLTLLPTQAGADCYRDSEGEVWRLYLFIRNNLALDRVENDEEFRAAGQAFGRFQSQLADFPAARLHEVIPRFHDTPKRFEDFRAAVERDSCRRAAEVAEEIAFFTERRSFCHLLNDAHARGELPLRVTHNDTKLNNILFDAATRRPLCVIDLDTVMPGFAVNDFGDAIRFGASTAAEDEQDLSKVHLSLSRYRAFARGFLQGAEGRLTATEVALLPMGARMMTLECGMRFLTDYLMGDVYFKTHRPRHNLDRCRTQIRLVAEMEACEEEMKLS